MKKRVVVGVIAAGVLFFGTIGAATRNQSSSTSNTAEPLTTNSAPAESPKQVATPTCDGTTVTSNCVAEGVNYSTYVYHPAEPEKSHTETVTTYTQKVTSYCTLCNDGTYSPSCATGRGTCSHHDGVAQWNAPVYSNVPENSTKTVVDAPAKAEYYEKVVSPSASK